MANSVYRVTEIVGTSSRSWEDAAKTAIRTAAKSLRDLRVAEVGALDVTIDDGKISAYRAKVKLSFKFEPEGTPAAAKAAPAPKPAASKKVAKKSAKKRAKRKARRR